MRRLVVALVALAAVVVLPATSAGGDPPTAVGWWTSENPGVPALVPQLVPSGGPVGVPSDVPPGGFEVTRMASVESYAAIAYDGYGGNVATKLVLKVAGQAANLPGQVQVCPLRGSGAFGEAQGDPLAAGPAYDCTTSVLAVSGPAGALAFDVGPLVRDGRLSVAVVAVGTSRMVFDRPDDSSIVVAGGTAAASSDLAGGEAPSPAGSADLQAPEFGTPPLPGDAPRSAPVTASHPAPAPRARVQDVQAVGTLTGPSGTTGAGSALGGALLVLLGAGVVAFRYRRPAPPAAPMMESPG